MFTLKALAALLTYPEPALIEAIPEIRAHVDGEKQIARADRARLAALMDELGASDPLDAQERYVALFDRGRATSLHLFEHLHGDSRDRGQAMVDLKALYARAGLTLAANELPDYLPALLEYLATRPLDEARDMLGDCAHILRAIGEALAARAAPYSAVFGALLTIAGAPGLDLKVMKAAASLDEAKGLDEEWLDAPVEFGPGCTGAKPQTQVIQFMKKVA